MAIKHCWFGRALLISGFWRFSDQNDKIMCPLSVWKVLLERELALGMLGNCFISMYYSSVCEITALWCGHPMQLSLLCAQNTKCQAFLHRGWLVVTQNWEDLEGIMQELLLPRKWKMDNSKLDSGSTCALLLTGGGQVDWGGPLDHDNENIFVEDALHQPALLSWPPREKLHCVSMWSVGRLRTECFAAATASAIWLSSFHSLLLRLMSSLLFYLSWTSCFPPRILLLWCFGLYPDSSPSEVTSSAVVFGWVGNVFAPVFWNRCGHSLNLLLSPSW